MILPLAEELIPCPDPWDVARKFAHLPHLLFLDSADRHPWRGRYSYVMAAGDTAFRGHAADPPPTARVRLERAYADVADRVATRPDLPPFQGGFAGLFGYEFGAEYERLPGPAHDEFGLPTLDVKVYRWVVSFDHAQDRAWVVAAGDPRLPADRSRDRAEADLRFVRGVLSGDVRPEPASGHAPADGDGTVPLVPQHPLPGHPRVTSSFSRGQYVDSVARAVGYVHAGDVFQVNLSQRLLTPVRERPLDLYGRLRRVSPAPFACYYDAGGYQIASASPEQFLKVTAGEVVTRPIKGTRPRGFTPAEDAARLLDLVTNSKDRAENVMIVDLLRNDLGRVCEFGSVRVPRVCEVETYNYVHHLVSEVRGRLRPGLTPFDLLRASFPGGSVTGAPKVRAMEIIAELEPTARGPYCGSIGFVGFDGAMDSSILIRTFTAGRGWLQFPVGGGIVADSDPDREYEETLHKAAGLLRALPT